MTVHYMPEEAQLAFAYVPFQRFTNLYSPDEALYNGTIFKDLNIPFKAYKDNPIMSPFK